MYIYMYIHMYIHMYIFSWHICLCVYSLCCIYTYIHVNIYMSPTPSWDTWLGSSQRLQRVSQMCTYTYIYTSIQKYAYIIRQRIWTNKYTYLSRIPSWNHWQFQRSFQRLQRAWQRCTNMYTYIHKCTYTTKHRECTYRYTCHGNIYIFK